MNRILFSDNGTLADLSVNLENFNYGTEAITYTKDEDYIYIGSMHPFNGWYFHPSVVNATPYSTTIETWDGSSWQESPDILDETLSMSVPGYINFVPNQSKSWTREDTVDNNGNARISELSSVSIYNLYWARFSFSESVTFTLKFVGHKFSNDMDLYNEFREFDNSTLLEAIDTGKTDWDAQSIRASRLLIEDLIARNVITYAGQILDRRKFMTANVVGTAKVIYNLLGRDYNDEYLRAVGEYEKRINKGKYNVDLNQDATLSQNETKARMGVLFK